MGGFSPIDQLEQMLAFGQYWDVYNNCNRLIPEASKDNEVRLYRIRAAAEMNIGMTKECIEDANHILKKSKDQREIENALRFRVKSNLKLGNYQEARKDCVTLNDVRLLKDLDGLINTADQAESLYKSGKFDEAIPKLDIAVSNSPQNGKYVIMRANIAYDRGDFGYFLTLTEPIMKDNANNGDLVFKRGIVSMCQNHMEDALRDLKASLKLRGAPKNASSAHSQISTLATLFDKAQRILSQSLSQGRPLSKSDETTAESTIKHMREHGSTFCPAGSELMQLADLIEARLLRAKGDREGALAVLDKSFDNNHGHGMNELHLERGEINFELKNWDAAIFDLQAINDPNNQLFSKAQQLLQRAQQEKKKADRVDYYATLGVDEHASHSEITSAYKKCVRKYHPDQFSDKEKKAEAEKKMKDVNIAYDIIGNEEKRRIYDMGQDPDNPGLNAQGFSGNPFDIINQVFSMNGFPFHGGEGGGGFRRVQFNNGNGFQFEMHFG